MTTPTSSTTPTPTSPTDNAPTPTSTTAPTSPKPTSPTTPNAGTKIPTNLTQDDIVIALMGITGSGKSTFISLLADDFVRVGHELSSCTADIEVHSFIYKNTRRVYLIDTPGFDDTNRTDTDVLKLLAFFLTTTYASTSLQLSGIIYCHRISDTRMGGSSLKNLNMFKKLCGEDAYASITLATTMWSNLNGPTLSFDTGVARERELLSRREWWGLMRERGSKVIRHDGSRESALAIVAGLVERREKSGPVVLNIQKEMIDDKLSLEDTAAGQEVERELTQAKKKFQEQIGELQESYDDALKERDEQLAQVLAEQREDLEKKLARAGEAQENLKITFEKLCEEKTAEYAVMAQEMKEERAAREAEYAARASELDRLQEEQEKDAERHRVEREKYETQRAEADKRMQELLSAQKTTEAERAREDKEKLDRMQAQMEQRFAWERQQAAQQQQAIQAQMAQLQQAKPSKEKSSLMPLISLFAGVATSGIGLLTLNPTAVLSGIGTALDGLSGAGGEQ